MWRGICGIKVNQTNSENGATNRSWCSGLCPIGRDHIGTFHGQFAHTVSCFARKEIKKKPKSPSASSASHSHSVRLLILTLCVRVFVCPFCLYNFSMLWASDRNECDDHRAKFKFHSFCVWCVSFCSPKMWRKTHDISKTQRKDEVLATPLIAQRAWDGYNGKYTNIRRMTKSSFLSRSTSFIISRLHHLLLQTLYSSTRDDDRNHSWIDWPNDINRIVWCDKIFSPPTANAVISWNVIVPLQQ